MKEFLIYTGLRLVLFAATWAIITAVWVLLYDGVSLGATALIALVVSGIGSYFVLRNQRERFAQHVQERASRAASRFEEAKAREDQD